MSAPARDDRPVAVRFLWHQGGASYFDLKILDSVVRWPANRPPDAVLDKIAAAIRAVVTQGESP